MANNSLPLTTQEVKLTTSSKSAASHRFVRIPLVLEHGIRFTQTSNLARPRLLAIPLLGPSKSGRLKIHVLKKPQGQLTLSSLTPNTDNQQGGCPAQDFFFEDEGASTQEDFVTKTNLQLNLMLAEGGGEHAKNRFGDKTNER